VSIAPEATSARSSSTLSTLPILRRRAAHVDNAVPKRT
jgi:hypothetical protein